MPAPQHLTPLAYAAALAALIEKDFDFAERDKRGIAAFADLHDHVDANEYYIDLDFTLGVDASVYDDEYVGFIGEASGLAFELFLNPRVREGWAARR